MTRARIHPAEIYDRLKAATRALVGAAGGPTHCERVTRGNASLMTRYGARQEEMMIPLDIIADLEREAGEPIVTRILADLADHVLVPKTAAEPTVGSVLADLPAVHESNHTLESEMLLAGIDGHIDEAEARRIDEACNDVQERVARIQARIRAKRAALKVVR